VSSITVENDSKSGGEEPKGPQDPQRIKEMGKFLDDSLEKKDFESIISCFSDDCRIELLGKSLHGKDGVEKWLNWMFDAIEKVQLTPVVIMVEGDVFFEEFKVDGTTKNGSAITSKQSEVLVYEDYKVKELRLYFDRLDFADAIADKWPSKQIVRRIVEISTKGLS